MRLLGAVGRRFDAKQRRIVEAIGALFLAVPMHFPLTFPILAAYSACLQIFSCFNLVSAQRCYARVYRLSNNCHGCVLSGRVPS